MPLPDQSNYQLALEQALRIASRKLAEADIEAQCRYAGARLAEDKKAVSLHYLNQPYRISLPIWKSLPQATRRPYSHARGC